MDRQVVKVYVRAGNHGEERTLSFRPPDEVPQSEWLRKGFAIDGNSVITTVTADTFVRQTSRKGDMVTSRYPDRPEDGAIIRGITPTDDEEQSLVEALLEVEQWLVEWLKTLGYEVEFA